MTVYSEYESIQFHSIFTLLLEFLPTILASHSVYCLTLIHSSTHYTIKYTHTEVHNTHTHTLHNTHTHTEVHIGTHAPAVQKAQVASIPQNRSAFLDPLFWLINVTDWWTNDWRNLFNQTYGSLSLLFDGKRWYSSYRIRYKLPVRDNIFFLFNSWKLGSSIWPTILEQLDINLKELWVEQRDSLFVCSKRVSWENKYTVVLTLYVHSTIKQRPHRHSSIYTQTLFQLVYYA